MMTREYLCAVLIGLTVGPALMAQPTESGAEAPAGVASEQEEAAAAEAEREFAGIVGTVLAKGLEPRIEYFNGVAQTLGFPKYEKGDVLRDLLVTEPGGGRGMLLRVRSDGRQDVVMMRKVKGNGGASESYFYVTSPKGRMISAFYAKADGAPSRVDSHRYVDAHKQEIAFWRKWQQDVHREMEAQESGD